jgi:signal transduction histidine kinase
MAPLHVFADPYGRGSYSSCSYQHCTPKLAETHITLPSGLEVSINLVNGQAIPRDGYIIRVTPLNGQGKSFKTVDFYIDGKLVQSGVQPDDTGTAQWEWKPSIYPGTTIKIVVTDSTGTVVTKQFTVHIVAKASNAPGAATLGSQEPSGLASILSAVSDGATRVIQSLPPPVVYSFPYVLFVLLGLNILLLLFQAKHELVEYHTLQQLLARLRAMNDGKKTFLDLASHYLRTPVTLISGGIDMLAKNSLPPQRLADLQAVNIHLRNAIEVLVGRVAAADKPAAPTVAAGADVHTWRQPGLFVPVLLIGIAAFSFTYLSAHAGSFTITQVNVSVQVIVFSMLAVTTYAAVRRRQLRRRDAALLRLIVRQESAAAEARDDLITTTAKALQADLKALAQLTAPMEPSQAATFIRNGQDRFRQLADKFVMATSLRGAHSQKLFTPVHLQQLLEPVQRNLAQKITAKDIRITGDTNASFSVQDANLLSFVLGTILDNAVAYSSAKGAVVVDVLKRKGQTVLQIVDHGPGIPAAKQALLFKPFSKADGAETFDHEGIGLSLYIDKLIMTYLGGSINLESRPGQTTVSLQLPVS